MSLFYNFYIFQNQFILEIVFIIVGVRVSLHIPYETLKLTIMQVSNDYKIYTARINNLKKINLELNQLNYPEIHFSNFISADRGGKFTH